MCFFMESGWWFLWLLPCNFFNFFYLTFCDKMLVWGGQNHLTSSLQPAPRNSYGGVWVGSISVTREVLVPPRTYHLSLSGDRPGEPGIPMHTQLEMHSLILSPTFAGTPRAFKAEVQSGGEQCD